MHTFATKYTFGDMVFLITDTMQEPRMVTGIRIDPGAVIYALSSGPLSSEHYEFEISSNQNIALSLGLNSEVSK